MLGPQHLEHLLTDEERKTFEEQGYLFVRRALPPDMVKQLEEVVDWIWRNPPNDDRDPRAIHPPADPKRNFFFPNFLWRHSLFLELLDWPTTFPKVWGILGWNIYSYHSHLIVTPPEVDRGQPRKTFGWHQDSGRVNVEMESSPRPRLSLKIAYFLTDVSEPDKGNLWIVPGSHLQDRLEIPKDGVSQPEGAVPVLAEPGDAVFFDRRLWHARGQNFSDQTRKVLFYGYGYRWLRPKDDMTIPRGLLERCDPIRRQLLGDGTCGNGYYSPRDEDVPLKVWLQEHGLL
ncbi:MAG: ectoine hydroxylase [Candidatus Poribacteria bacterium]|nr:MAG: ectoine hydroxylase [Candidatus Poribacteria bacterium]